jgi:membrane protein implicated in regulation of membrane protease activity
MGALRKLVLGETVALPAGVALVLVAALALDAIGGSWWVHGGGFILLALVVAVLAVSLAPAHRRR